MTAPRHLWSGEWRRESAEAAKALTGRRRSTDSPAEPPPPEPPPAHPSPLDRLVNAIRTGIGALGMAIGALGTAIAALRTAVRNLRTAGSRRVRGAVLTGAAMLLAAGVAYAAVSALVTSDTASSAGAQHASMVSSAPAWLGVDTTSFPLTTGAMIVDVASGSPADVAGLQPGDVITEIGNHSVQSPADVDAAVASLRAGQQVQVGYQRGATAYTTQVTLQTRPSGP